MKSGNLNFLEPSGPLQACNGTALPLYRRHEYTVRNGIYVQSVLNVLKSSEKIFLYNFQIYQLFVFDWRRDNG